jgi:hypothetical protein
MTLNSVHVLSVTVETSSPTIPSQVMTQNLQSGVFDLSDSYIANFGIVWTGTPTGTFTVLGSLDGVSYHVSLGTQALTGAAGNYNLNLTATTSGIQSVYITYTFTSGTGTWTVAEMCKKIER